MCFFFSLDTSFLGKRVPGIKPGSKYTKHELPQLGATPSFKSRASCMSSRFRYVGLRMVWFLSVIEQTQSKLFTTELYPTPSAGFLKAGRLHE